MPSHEPRGVPRERTGLAWERSALGYVVLSGVVLGVAAHRDAPALIVVSAAFFGVALAVWRQGRHAYEDTAVAPQTRAVALLSLATMSAAVTAAVAVLAT